MIRTCLPFLLLLLALGVAGAEDYLPLDTGNVWTYVGSAGGQYTDLVTGMVAFHGTTAWEIHHEVSDFDDFDNYWTVDSDGIVRCWGFEYPDGSGVVYPEGFMAVVPPLWLGKSWSQTVTYYMLPDTTVGGTMEFTCVVLEEADLTVPAGTFHVFGIGQAFPGGLPSDFRRDVSLTGVPGGRRDGQATDWWTDQVGRVRFLADQTYDLESFHLPTPVQASSWGAIKALYHSTGRSSPQPAP